MERNHFLILFLICLIGGGLILLVLNNFLVDGYSEQNRNLMYIGQCFLFGEGFLYLISHFLKTKKKTRFWVVSNCVVLSSLFLVAQSQYFMSYKDLKTNEANNVRIIGINKSDDLSYEIAKGNIGNAKVMKEYDYATKGEKVLEGAAALKDQIKSDSEFKAKLIEKEVVTQATFFMWIMGDYYFDSIVFISQLTLSAGAEIFQIYLFYLAGWFLSLYVNTGRKKLNPISSTISIDGTGDCTDEYSGTNPGTNYGTDRHIIPPIDSRDCTGRSTGTITENIEVLNSTYDKQLVDTSVKSTSTITDSKCSETASKETEIIPAENGTLYRKDTGTNTGTEVTDSGDSNEVVQTSTITDTSADKTVLSFDMKRNYKFRKEEQLKLLENNNELWALVQNALYYFEQTKIKPSKREVLKQYKIGAEKALIVSNSVNYILWKKGHELVHLKK